MKQGKTWALTGIGLAGVLGLWVLSLGGTAYSEEGDGPKRQRWIIDMTHGPLKTVGVRDGKGATQYVHYMTVKVSNKTGHPRVWVPEMVAKTDTGKTYYSGGNGWALETIRRAERNNNLELLELTSDGKHRLGNGVSKEAVAIFGAVDPLYDRIVIEFSGLVDPVAIFRFDKYGEDEIIRDAVYFDRNQKILKKLKRAAAEAGGELSPPSIEYREVREDRYFEMVYQRLGDEFNAQDDKIEFVSEGWKARGDLKVLRVFGKNDQE